MSEDRPYIHFGMALSRAVEFALEVSDDVLLRAVIERDDELIHDRLSYWCEQTEHVQQEFLIRNTGEFTSAFEAHMTVVGIDIQNKRLRQCHAILDGLAMYGPSAISIPPEVTLYSLLAEERAALEP